jgi:hypothetical protein
MAWAVPEVGSAGVGDVEQLLGSLNQIEPSDFTTTSLGELRRLPSKRSASTRRVPSCSMRETQRVRCSQQTSRPSRSTLWPLWLSAGERKTETAPLVSS